MKHVMQLLRFNICGVRMSISIIRVKDILKIQHTLRTTTRRQDKLTVNRYIHIL
jgi:hypothetical protein